MKTVKLPATQTGVNLAASALSEGKLVAIPTETVYGLAGDATNIDAITEIYRAKERPSFDPLIVHVPRHISSVEALIAAQIVADDLNTDVKQLANRLINAYWPGPLTIIFPRGPLIPDVAASGLPTVGVRMPQHPLTLQLLDIFGGPLVAPSANRFGRISPTSAEHVLQELEGRIPLVLDGGKTEIGIESTIIELTDEPTLIRLLRAGGITTSQLQKFEQIENVSEKSTERPVAPGTLSSHYAPTKPAVAMPDKISQMTASEVSSIVRSAFSQTPDTREASRKLAILTQMPLHQSHIRAIEAALAPREIIWMTLSQRGDSREAARCLFTRLRDYDEGDAGWLFVERITLLDDLWPAIGDRLRRATIAFAKLGISSVR